MGCPLTCSKQGFTTEEEAGQKEEQMAKTCSTTNQQKSTFGPWMVAQKVRRRQGKAPRGNFVNIERWLLKITL